MECLAFLFFYWPQRTNSSREIAIFQQRMMIWKNASANFLNQDRVLWFFSTGPQQTNSNIQTGLRFDGGSVPLNLDFKTEDDDWPSPPGQLDLIRYFVVLWSKIPIVCSRNYACIFQTFFEIYFKTKSKKLYPQSNIPQKCGVGW